MKFDVVIIGAGPAGYEAAVFAAKQGLNTAVIEKAELGGTCLNNGCIPTKTLLHTADLYHEVQSQSAQIGLTSDNFAFSMTTMQERKNFVLNQLRNAIAQLFKANKITLFTGTAKIIGEQEISVTDKENNTTHIQAAKILITSGSVPAIPPIEGADLAQTSDDLLKCETAYDNLIIIGGGVIGIEFASLYTSLGKNVIVIEALDRILANMDKEFAQSLKMILTKRGAQIKTKAFVTKITEENGKFTCQYKIKDKVEEVTADAVLMAVGRRPYSDNLFDEAFKPQIEFTKNALKVNEYYQTTCPSIYAAGDVIGGIQLAHVATAEAINAICHILGKQPIYDMNAIPSCVYTNPEIASVGMSAEEAKKLGKKITSLKYPMSANGKSLLSLQERGFIKIIVEPETNIILGAQLMCARATDIISQITMAIDNKLTVADLQKVIYPHPTFSEGIGQALL